jgi:hypothetical protein
MLVDDLEDFLWYMEIVLTTYPWVLVNHKKKFTTQFPYEPMFFIIEKKWTMAKDFLGLRI